MTHVIAIASLAAACGGWILLQRWIAREMPEAPGVGRRCDGCPGLGACEHRRACANEGSA